MIDLFAHNKAAYDSAVSMLSAVGRAAIVHPTGTGKSLIGFKLCEDHPDKTVCWLSPSDYIFKTQLENLARVSDGYVPSNIRSFTYAKLMNLSDGELASIRPDYIVLDEFHRCGAQEWGRGVKTLLSLYEDVPVLGLSATAIRYLDNQRDMAEELFDGHIASEMTLGDAIVRGILAAPRYVLSVFSYRKELERYEARVKAARNSAVRGEAEKYLEALRRTLEKAEGLEVIFDKHMTDRTGKYIVFCSSLAHMQEMIDRAGEWFSLVDPAPRIYSVYSDDPAASASFAAFRQDTSSDHLRLLYCIDALNEGVHVDDVSGVILLRPTVSPTVFKQQIGRALAAGKRDEPVIFDIVLNIESLYGIGAIEEEMRLAATYYRAEGRADEIVREQFRVIDEVRDCRVLFERLNDTLTASWEVMYTVAKRYYEAHGDLAPMNRYRTTDGYALGAWLNTQRMVRRGTVQGYLSEEQIARLDAIGMRWETKSDYVWSKYYAELLKYHAQYGSIDMPSGYKTENGLSLGGWIVDLRANYRAGGRSAYLTKERIRALDALGMIWSKTDRIWETNCRALAQYREAHGNVELPRSYRTEDGLALGAWLYNIKAGCRAGKSAVLTQVQREQLEALGVDLSGLTVSEKRWNEHFEAAKAYFAAHGDLCVPYDYTTKDGFALGTWLSRLRVAERRGKRSVLTEERRRQLDGIGMVWEYTDVSPWARYYAALQRYHAAHGDLCIPTGTVEDGLALGTWLVGKRMQYRNGKLPETEKRALDALGMDWSTREERQWEDAFALAQTYRDQHGDLNVPRTEQRLYTWLRNQRTKHRKGLLSSEREMRLSGLGMDWGTDDAWSVAYEQARTYYRTHGNLDIPATYVTEDGVPLGNWYRTRRREYLNGTLSDERKRLLEEIGMQTDSVIKRSWEQNYEQAERFFKENGHLDLRADYVTADGVRLGKWLGGQRERYKQGKLTKEQIERLERIGMQWDRFDANWDAYYAQAQAYFQAHGDLNVPTEHETQSGLRLGAWLATQRSKYRRFKLSQKQIQALEDLHIVWEPTDSAWDEGYRHAAAFYREEHHLNVGSGYICGDGFRLGAWLSNKKTGYRTGKLHPDRIAALEGIGIVWDRRKREGSGATHGAR